MPSFQITVSPNRRAAARFIETVRRMLQKAFVEENRKSGITQSDIARKIGVHRSVISRELRGYENLTLGRVAELAWALGRRATVSFPETVPAAGTNIQPSADSPPMPLASTGEKEISLKTDPGVWKKAV
jgi:transcriptional regulator with XRE-family HTH domain